MDCKGSKAWKVSVIWRLGDQYWSLVLRAVEKMDRVHPRGLIRLVGVEVPQDLRDSCVMTTFKKCN